MRKDLYSMKMLMRWALAAALAFAGLQAPSLAQAPIILSAGSAPLIFELPLDANTTQSLAASTAIRLATPAQHAAQGMLYPEWLSDASFNVRSRAGQRLAIVVTAKRSNPDLSTELLLTLNNAGRRSFQPLHLMFDTLSSYAGTPLPTAAASNPQAIPENRKPDLTALLAPIIQFAADPESALKSNEAVATPVPDVAVADFNKKGPRSSTASLRTRNIAVQAEPTKTSVAPQASVLAPASAPAAPMLPPRSVKPLQPSGSTTESDNWLSNWPIFAGGFAILLALLYLVRRAFKNWFERRTNHTMTTFLEPRPTVLAPEESGTNTVFGVSEEEANAMHAKWLRQQIPRSK